MSWVSDACESIASLRGKRITRATVVKMALIDQGPGGLPVFRHPAAPFVQAIKIELALDDGRFALFSNYQNDGDFPISMGILAESSIEAHWADATREGEPSIYRLASPPNFPLGLVTSAETRLNANGDIAEVAMAVEGREVVLRAGEVIEHAGNTFAFCDMAGSILLFLSADARSTAKLNETLSWR
ncbi:MAG TPA: hypothetical protein VHC73_08345 [Vitreimonas sp.]|nr:hypothetical protein [Vitreimonas sp.]